jgi:hypothetical protein|nr:hypothetical protein [uncultured Lachnoanaerobaculum sp.]
MKLKYRNRIYIALILMLVVCIINVLTGMYELMSSDYNVIANQIIWNGARYNRDETGYKRIDELENLVEIPKDCDVKDIWEVASYYAKDDSECDARLKELEKIYDTEGKKATVENILSKELGNDKKTVMEYLIVDGILIYSLKDGDEVLNTVIKYCFDRDYGFLGYKRYIDIGSKLYRKNEKLEEIIKAFEILSKYTVDRAISMPETKDEDEKSVETGYYHSMIQLFQTFSSMSYFADDLLLAKSYPDSDNKEYIVRAIIKENYDIVLSYKKYKSFINLGNISIYGKYKNLNMIVQYTGFGYLDYRDIEENIEFRSIAIRKVYDKLLEIDIMSDYFRLRSTYVLVYDPYINTIEGFSYGIYPGFILFNETNIDTPEAIKNFNTNFSKGGYFGEFANEVGYDENDPLTLENFGERMDEIWNMIKENLMKLKKDYNISMEMTVKDLSGEEPLKRKD